MVKPFPYISCLIPDLFRISVADKDTSILSLSSFLRIPKSNELRLNILPCGMMSGA